MAKNNKKAQVKLNPPQMVYHARLQALFATDPEVTVSEFDHELNQIVITVSEIEKFIMLSKLIGGVHPAGNMRWTVKVVLADRYTEKCSENPIEQLFRGNKNYDRVIRMPGSLTDLDVAVFKPALVQVAEDDAFNPDGGIVTYTYEQLVCEIFGEVLPQTKYTTSAIKVNKK